MVSIIIPIYNGERYIEKCLESVLRQTYRDIEIIAVDDGSTDGTATMLDKYAAEHRQIHVIHKPNTGAAQARMCGIEAAKGDYIGFMDIDDWIEPDMYQQLTARLALSHADIVCCDYVLEYPNRTVPVSSKLEAGETTPLSGERALWYMHRRRAVFQFMWNKIYRRSLFDGVDFAAGSFIGEDYEMQAMLFAKTEKIDVVGCLGYHYVQTAVSVCRDGYTDRYLLSMEHYRKNYQTLTERYPHFAGEIANYHITEYMSAVVAMARNHTYHRALIKEIKAFVRGHLGGYLGSRDVPFFMKGCALALSIARPFLTGPYRLFYAIRK